MFIKDILKILLMVYQRYSKNITEGLPKIFWRYYWMLIKDILKILLMVYQRYSKNITEGLPKIF